LLSGLRRLELNFFHEAYEALKKEMNMNDDKWLEEFEYFLNLNKDLPIEDQEGKFLLIIETFQNELKELRHKLSSQDLRAQAIQKMIDKIREKK
jgi:hypothetical protein